MPTFAARPLAPALLLAALVLPAAAIAETPLAAPPPRTAPERPVAELVADLAARDWRTVRRAKEALEAQQEEAVPALLALLDRRDVLPLTDTLDLIYPGAATFYGHGSIVDYDLDALGVRAGWVLEAITFQDFGFREGAVREELLRKAGRDGAGDRPLAEVTGRTQPLGRTRAAESAARARSWWQKAGKSWTRLQGVREALDSGAEQRLLEVLNWIRFGTTPCDGYDPRWFEAHVLPRARQLAKSPADTLRRHAELILRDGFRQPEPYPETEGIESGVK